MKRTLLLLALLPLRLLEAQPMNGTYTVGGSAPDFATLQEAADSLSARGVAGPVFVNIRPGIYIRNGGLDAVMNLMGPLPGLSAENRITFQPDQAAHGNVENVILRIDQSAQTSVSVVSIRVDFTTVRELTLEDIDSAEAGANQLLFVSGILQGNPTVEGSVVEGCRFIGNPSSAGGTTFGTDFGILADNTVTDIAVRRCSFQRLMRSINAGTTGIGSGSGFIVVEDNTVRGAHFGTSGTGSFLGHGILANARNVVVRRNLIDNTDGRGSFFGILVAADTGSIERNRIINLGSTGSIASCRAIDVSSFPGAAGGAMTISNNMISGTLSGSRTGILARRRVQIVHNTIVHPEKRQISRGIVFDLGVSDSSTVMNNIIIDHAINVVGTVTPFGLFDQTDGVNGLVSDYNVFFLKNPGGFLIKRGSTVYNSLSDYQLATGLDEHTIVKSVDFLSGLDDLHLSECQGQDSGILGIPVPGIIDDIDGDARSATAPFRGADEGGLRLSPMFSDVFRIPVPGTPMSIAAGQVDNFPGIDLAIGDYDNRQVHVYRNDPASRSFARTASLDFGFKPTIVKLHDLDADGHLDVIAAAETALVHVYWGDGLGGFPDQTSAATLGRVVSIEPFGPHSIAMTEDNGFLPDKSFLGVVTHTTDPGFPGLRILCHSALIRDAGLFAVTDTVDGVMSDLSTGEFDGDPGVEAIALALSAGVARVVTFGDFVFRVEIGGGVCGDRYSSDYSVSQFNVGSFVGHMSNIISGDFDNDGDVDFVTTGFVGTRIPFLTSDGNLSLTESLLPSLPALAVVGMDYDGDGKPDFVTMNRQLEDNGVTVFLGDGAGNFTQELNCYARLGSGVPFGAVASDFDQDGRTDIAIASSYDSVFVLYNSGGAATDIAVSGSGSLPDRILLYQNYPNPFNPSTTIRFTLPRRSSVTLALFNVLGQQVRVLSKGELAAGLHEVRFDATGLSSGVYFYTLTGGDDVHSKKLVLLR